MSIRVTPQLVPLLASCFLCHLALAQSNNATDPNERAPQQQERLEVPDGEIDAVVDFMNRMSERRHQMVTEFRRSVTRTYQAERRAANRILERSTEVEDAAFLRAAEIALGPRVNEVPTSDREQQEATLDLVARQLRLRINESSKPENVEIASTLTRHLEEYGPNDLAIKANRCFAQIFQEAANQRLSKQIQSFEASVRRLSLLGKPLDLSLQSADGHSLDWSIYDGKTLLIGIWSIDDDATKDEIDRLRLPYECYRSAGFEILGICAGKSEADIRGFLKNNPTPWNMIPDRVEGDQSLARQLGIERRPASILRDGGGTVVSLKASGRRYCARMIKTLTAKRAGTRLTR